MKAFDFSLKGVFCACGSAVKIGGQNDNDAAKQRDYLRGQHFTRNEMKSLDKILFPYYLSGQLKRADYKPGERTSHIVLERGDVPRNGTVFAVVKHMSDDKEPYYAVNFGIGYQPTTTINFPEVERLARMHLGRALHPSQNSFTPALTH